MDFEAFIDYRVKFNGAHRCRGTVLQGRFKSVLIQEESKAVEVARYLHLNPVRIGGLGLSKTDQRKARGFNRWSGAGGSGICATATVPAQGQRRGTDPGAKDEAAEPLGRLGEGGRSDQGRGMGRMVGAARGLGSGRSDVRGSASRRAAVGRGGPTREAEVSGGGAGGEAVWTGAGK